MNRDADDGLLRPQDRQRFRAGLASRSTRQGWFERVLRVTIRAWCRLVDWRLVVGETGPLPLRDGVAGAGCVVVAAPHRAWVEPFLLAAAWPPGAARLVWLADGATVSRSWWRRRLLPRLGVIPIASQGGGPRAYAELAAEACRRGLAVVVFPEVGPPSPPARARRISPGFAYLALRAGAPVVPVVIGGTHHIVRGSRFSIDIGRALDPGAPVDDPFTPVARQRAHALVARFEQVVAARLPERTRAADAAAPPRDRWTWLARLFG
jgi:1-acyl-sn-glycerol-3-phosphate acyltransferase